MRSPVLLLGTVLATLLCLTVMLACGLHAREEDQINKAMIYTAPSRAQKSSAVPIRLRAGPHLFLDDFLLETSTNLRRVVNRPVRDPALPNPIVTGEEDGCFQPYLSVLRDPITRRFRMWYGARTEARSTMESRLAYLESNDGIRWNRPHRLLTTPVIQFGASVLDEGPSYPDRARRFKFGWYAPPTAIGASRPAGDPRGGLKVAASPDGLTWKQMFPEGSVDDIVLRHNHDINSIFRDTLRDRYVATVSIATTGKTWSGTRRVTLQSVSKDLLHWETPWYVLTPDDRLDEGQTQFYAMDGFLIRGGLWIGMVKVLRDDLKANDPPDPPDAYGIGYTTLAWSRDGEHWVRDRETFFDRDPRKGTWDHAHAWIDEQLPVGDQVYLYYGGYARGHKVNRFEERQIGLVRMQRDRYVAREAGAEGGGFTTPLVALDADAMTLNADARGGEIRVQVLDSQGKPIPGFTFADCKPIQSDALAVPVHWQGALARLKERPVRLEFSLKRARLFAFEFFPSSTSGRPLIR